MKCLKMFAMLLVLVATGYGSPRRQQQEPTPAAAATQTKIRSGAKVFVAPMAGFEVPLKKAIAGKKVPIEVVEQREQAEYEITGAAESKKASTAKKVVLNQYSALGHRSSAEACAKHLKDEAIAPK